MSGEPREWKNVRMIKQYYGPKSPGNCDTLFHPDHLQHVIEYSAYQALQQKLAVAVQELEHIIIDGISSCSDCDGGEYKIKIAREALEKLK